MIEITSATQIDELLGQVDTAARRTHDWLLAHAEDSIALFKAMKFDPVGRHPVEDRPLNIIEQVNQTWTFTVALLATRQLLKLHPEAQGFKVAPGAHMSLPLDIMSIVPGLVGAETFAAVKPSSNNKLNKDLLKLSQHRETYRYVFMMCPDFRPGHHPKLDRCGVQVWAVEPDAAHVLTKLD